MQVITRQSVSGVCLVLALPAILSISAGASTDSRVPLCPGLSIVGAMSEPQGDYEAITRVESIDDRGIHLHYSAQVRTRQGTVRNANVKRTVLHQDLRTASLVVNWFDARGPVVIPGSTAISASSAVLRALKGDGAAALARLSDGGSSGLPADRNTHPNIYDYQTVYQLQRVGTGTVKFAAIVNDSRVELPAIHATGKSPWDTGDFFFLDDESNPLALEFRIGGIAGGATPEGAVLQGRVIKIAYRCPANAASTPESSRLERALAGAGRADVYDIYFAFGSDEIRAESEPTLKEIAEMLRRRPDWKLTIAGHTDNIASDSYNLDLSSRRAAAVKRALVGSHGIGAARLSTSGMGESSPKDRNDTLEGRASNRRVELVRQP